MSRITVPRGILTTGINSYSDDGHERKLAFHRDGKKFLSALAKLLGLAPADYRLSSNVAGIAVSGEVTLHADHLYVQMYESCTGPGVEVMYRACRGRKDYTGQMNHFVKTLALRDSDRQASVLEAMRRLMENAKNEALASV